MSELVYLNASTAYRRALAELKFRTELGVPTIHCPATGRAVLPIRDHPASAEFERDPSAYLDRIPTVLFVYLHESDQFLYLRDDVEFVILAERDKLADSDGLGDFEMLVEHTPDFGDAFTVLDVEESAASGHRARASIGLDLSRAV